MKRYWLILAQAVTIGLGLYLVVLAVRPDWVGRHSVLPQQAGGPGTPAAVLQG
ncbi:2-alkenal reductase, partial [Massilia arenosa]